MEPPPRLPLVTNSPLSTQVVQEYFVAATKKLGVPAEVAHRKVELFSWLDLVAIAQPDILGAIDLHRLHGISLLGRANREGSKASSVQGAAFRRYAAWLDG